MSLFNTEHKRKSATITTVLMVLLLIFMFIFGKTYMDPPIESGIAVNFGTSNTGSGDVETQKNPKPVAAPKQQQEEQEEQPQETEPVQETQPDTSSEEVITQESEESIALKKAEEEKKRKADEEAKAKAEADRIAKAKADAEAKKKAEEAAKKAKIDALFNDANGNGEDESEGEGPNDGPGNKGNPNGDPYAASYYGEPGSGNGGGGGYGLNGRSKLASSKVLQECNKAGTIVVAIKVNRNGEVISAEYSPKGSTSTESCLIDAAIKTAKTYKWNKDAKAPSKQVGFIVVNFKLGQ
ncbi:protein TolA [Kordia sp. SMS9]|uniref:energy transducer TonB n=1 Tax=Kordia sp. SMS9 TaxID=2282170 RepID=UPI000E0DD858|nr:energy transducer TonB [Kordia sp. SMS9]AXG67996.1 protein TolA [Kordia sp. SMS9]